MQIVGSIEQQTESMQPKKGQLTYDALVLDAYLKQSLATVRSLGSRGLRVAALGTSSRLPTFASRWCQQAFICPAEEGSEAYFHYLEQLLDRINVLVLITSSDATISLVRRHRGQLEQRVRIALAKESALQIAVNKERTLEIAKRLGLHIPRTVGVGTVNEVEAALRVTGLPVAVKPVESWSWRGEQGERLNVQQVTTQDEAKRAVEELTRFGGTTLFQQFIPGTRESISFLYAQDQIYARFAQRHMRIVGGHSSLRQSIPIPPDFGDQAECLIREIDLEGCSQVEFRRDDAGNPYLMEVNPRLWASTEHAVRSGVDFPYVLYQWASGEKIDMVKDYRVGVRLRYLRGDITVATRALRQRHKTGTQAKDVLDFCLSFFVPMRYDYVDWKDPLPAWRATVGSVREVLQRLGRMLTRRKSH